MKPWPRLRRILKGLGFSVLALLTSLVAAVSGVTGSESGRALLLNKVLKQVNSTIPGHVTVRELARLDLLGLHLQLRGARVADPSGQEVARFDEFDAQLALSELLFGRIKVPNLRLAGGLVDLRQLTQPREGLLAAFIDPDAAPSAPSTGPPPYIQIGTLRLRRFTVRAPAIGPLGQLDLADLDLNASYELDGLSAGNLEHLTATVRRTEIRIGSFQLSGRLERGTTPSTAQLKLQLEHGATLEASASLVIPPQADWKQLPVNASVQLQNVTAKAVAGLLQDPALEGAFLGSASLGLEVSGTPNKLETELQLDSAAGKVATRTQIDDFERLKATLSAHNFQPQRLRADLPARRLTLQLETEADLKDPDRVPLQMKLHDSTIDETPLPTVNLVTTLTPKQARALTLRVVDGPSHLELSGDVGFAGTVDGAHLSLLVEPDTLRKWNTFSGADIDADGQIQADLELQLNAQQQFEVSGNLKVRRLRMRDIQVQQALMKLQLSGTPSRPQGNIEVDVRSAQIAGEKIKTLSLHAGGDLDHYQVALKADAATASGALNLKLARGSQQVKLEGRGQGRFRSRPWNLRLAPTTVGFDGQLQTEGIAATLAGQGLNIRGRFSPGGGVLQFESGVLDVAELAQLFGLAQPARGQLQLKGQLSSTPELPKLELTMNGSGLTLGERPALAFYLRSTFDARRGQWTAHSTVRSGKAKSGQRPLELTLDLSHDFRGGAGFPAAILDGTLDANLSLTRLDLKLAEAWTPPGSLPLAGVVQGTLRAQGTRHDPKVRANLDGELTLLGAALRPRLEFEYAASVAELQLSVDDAQSRWLDLQANLDLADTPLSVSQLLQRLPASANDSNWSLKLATQERELSALPGLAQQALYLRAAGELQVSHAPGSEPSADLRVTLRPTQEFIARVQTRCARSSGQLQLKANLNSGKLSVDLGALEGGRSLLNAHFAAPLALAPALRGGQPILGALRGQLSTQSLDLQALPLFCSSARGKVSANAQFEDLLGAQPRATVEVKARGFSMGSRQTLDATLTAAMDQRSARAEARFSSEQRRSELSLELPLKLSNGKTTLNRQAPLKANLDLRHLPLAPFLDPRGAVSYASGTLDGKVQAQGSLEAPSVHGRIALEDLAFTATGLAQPLRQVSGVLSFTEDRLVFRELLAHDKDGVIKLDGELNFKDSRHIRLDFAVKATEFPIRQQGQVVATADLDANVKVSVRPDKTDVRVDLGAVDLWIESLETRSGIDLTPHDDFVIDGQTVQAEPAPPPRRAGDSAEPRSPPPAKPSSPTEITLSASDRVWVKRDDFAVKVNAELTTHIEDGAAQVEGRVNFLRGYLVLLGKEFDIQSGSHLKFIGSATPDPVIDIVARHENRRSGETISVEISGRSSAPMLNFKVDDRAVPAGQAFQAIYGSQQSNQDPASAGGQAKAFVGGLVAGLLATTARRELGAAAPIVMIEPGESGVERVRAGFEFDSLVPEFLRDIVTGVYVEGIVAKESSSGGSTDQQATQTEAGVLVELYFLHNLFSAGQYGPGPTWSIDFGWQL